MPKILVADDSRVQVHLLTEWLQEVGFEVLTTFDSVQASINAIRTEPDVIILDVNMPGGSGIALLKRLKSSTKTSRIPVVVVSGNAGSEMRDLAIRLGAADLLQKPLDRVQLCDLVSRLVSVT